jgi:hypothetical protein
LQSLLALILPLIRVYRQIHGAKIHALTVISAQLVRLQDALVGIGESGAADAADIGAHATALVTLRKTIRVSELALPHDDRVVRAVAVAMTR